MIIAAITAQNTFPLLALGIGALVVPLGALQLGELVTVLSRFALLGACITMCALLTGISRRTIAVLLLCMLLVAAAQTRIHSSYGVFDNPAIRLARLAGLDGAGQPGQLLVLSGIFTPAIRFYSQRPVSSASIADVMSGLLTLSSPAGLIGRAKDVDMIGTMRRIRISAVAEDLVYAVAEE